MRGGKHKRRWRGHLDTRWGRVVVEIVVLYRLGWGAQQRAQWTLVVIPDVAMQGFEDVEHGPGLRDGTDRWVCAVGEWEITVG